MAGRPIPHQDRTLLPGHRRVVGVVHEVTADHIKMDIGEVQPLFLPLKQAEDKGFPTITEGDLLTITLNAQALFVDFHPASESEVAHRVLRGRLSQALPVGHEYAVIRVEKEYELAQRDKKTREIGKELSYPIRPLARSKMAAIPVDVDAVFVIDEAEQIADATFGSPDALKQAEERFKRKSAIKGAHRRIEGTVAEPLSVGLITIRTSQQDLRTYEVRSPVEGKLAGLEKGQAVILLLDTDDHVIDAAVPPSPHQ